MAINNGIINDYRITPKNITGYKARRGIMDFTQLGMFDQFESGYSFLSVLKMPKFMEVAASQDAKIEAMVNSVKFCLEYEFRGITGLPDITSQTFTLTDGANEMAMINDVQRDTSVQVTMNFFEKRGALFTSFAEYYLTGIKDPISKAKTYHGLIENNLCEAGLENEVFTFLYYVTDNTMRRLERAFLLCNAQLTSAPLSELYNGTRGQMENKDLSLEFNCYPITGYEVDKAAYKLLADIVGTEYKTQNSTQSFVKHEVTSNIPAALDSAEYKYAVMDPDAKESYIPNVFDR